jgi:2-C-methyl-D-erythritol 2,4-cyclodiphosphate synthase
MRIGHGYDVHRLQEGRRLVLGGVEIPHPRGLLGHSDADVVIHAVIDALLGAVAAGDIGQLFPDTDEKYRDIDSRVLLIHAAKIVHDNGYEVGNLDCTICAQEPKLRPYIDRMRQNLAIDLNTELQNISVKATTEEGLGVSGMQGISATAVVLLKVL